MDKKISLIITSVSSASNEILKSYAEQCAGNGVRFILAGDLKTPAGFSLPGCEYLDINAQHALPFQLPKLLPDGHYSKKNAAYLQAIRKKSEIIIETDDDNLPADTFWAERNILVEGDLLDNRSWLNVYDHFADKEIWPRGYSLKHLNKTPGALQSVHINTCLSPVQQGLADENPDVDAIYRLNGGLPFYFKKRDPVILKEGTVCPFNSQNTTWFRPAFMLLYLPSYCSFRMCDIWRSLIAQRIMWENGWKLSFHNASVIQKRNEHDLYKDLDEELEGYLYNEQIMEDLRALDLLPGETHLAANLLKCYEMMVGKNYIGAEELSLVKAWVTDLKSAEEESAR